jgi:hydroxymethylpyrimidine pyrophosphatase-like HAD family hydrolase
MTSANVNRSMRYAALAVDFDGTIAHDSVCPPHVIDGLKRLKATGRRLLLVTGRELPELLSIFHDIGIFDRVVAENGALLYRPASGERVELGEPPPPALVEALRARGIPLSVGQSIIATVEPHETAVLEVIRGLGLECQVIFNKGAVMILPAGVNKASGMAVALAELGLSARNVVACGDGENDHAMLDSCEYSVAVSNAIATLQAKADRVTIAKRGDGILEVIEDLITDDLRTAQPAKARRSLPLGKDNRGEPVALPAAGVSMLVAGGPSSGKSSFVIRMLEAIAAAGYQYCVLDTRGEYLKFNPAVVFGTRDHTPDVTEVLTALEKPGVQAVVCLLAVPEAQRPGFVAKLLHRLAELRATTGRPHWIVIDEAQEAPASGPLGGEISGGISDDPSENAIHVSSDPAALAAEILSGVDVVVGRGADAFEAFAAFAAAAGVRAPAPSGPAPATGEALLWWRRTQAAPSRIGLSRKE